MQERDYSGWEPPERLRERLLLPWPSDAFPPPFDMLVKELALATETPIELGASVLLATVAAAVQKRYRLEVKTGYREPVNIWTLAILQPGSRKSPVYSEMTTPLLLWEEKKKKELVGTIRLATSRKKTMEARIKELRNKAGKEKKDGYEQLEAEIFRLEEELPIIPVPPRIWADDVTTEQLGHLMEIQGGSLAVLSDEGGIFSILNGMYSKGEANFDLYLKGYSGGSVRVDRCSREPIFMKEVLLTMGLTVQPHILKSVCANKNFRGRGLVGRALFFYPDSNIGYRTLEEHYLSSEVVTDFREAIYAILEEAHLPNSQKEPDILYLEEEAFEVWKKCSKGIESFMKEGSGFLSEIVDWASKLAGGIARIAALIHIMRYSHDMPAEYKVSKKDMMSAVAIGNVLMTHALKTFDLIGEDEGYEVAYKISTWLRGSEEEVFTKRECARKFRTYNKNQLEVGLNFLCENNIIRRLEKNKGVGRKSDVFQVNPYFLDEA